MKTIYLTISLTLAAVSLFAQNKKIDLAADPSKPVLTNKSNAQLLRDSKEEPAKTNDSIANMKVSVPNTGSPNSSSQIDQNGQRLNTQSSEINVGNSKAKSTIHYDNSGRVQGSGTSIEFGK